MSSQDLTTLAALKNWLGLSASVSPNDAALAALITAASRTTYAALSRPTLLPQTYVDTYDCETSRVFLRQWPVLQVNSVALDGYAVPAAASGAGGASNGYAIPPAGGAPPGAPQALDLFERRPSRRRQNLSVNYLAGYAVLSEAQIAPASTPWTVNVAAPYGPWASDLGVVHAATGVALAPVAGAPQRGQYSVGAGAYLFAAADAGAPVLISYGYTPQDLAQAALELAAERFRAADRIGLRSKSIGGQETISYASWAISAPILAMLQPYRRVTL